MKNQSASPGLFTATRREVIGAASMGFSMVALGQARAADSPLPQGMTQRIARSAETIHQEVELAATPARVYAALTDAKQFHQVTLLSAAVSSGMVKITSPAQISAAPGGAFSLFGGHITGRMIDMVPGTRLVQAWRAGDWADGAYSIAHLYLVKHGAGTLLVFDHQGFPAAQAEHLAEGWRANYWVPLAKYLGQPPGA
jgi:uncharacterized protein YndB with AHSA1/START domain